MIYLHKLQRLILDILTKTDQNPWIGLRGRGENSVDHPEGVENLDPHPSEGAEQGVMEARRHPGAQALPCYVG